MFTPPGIGLRRTPVRLRALGVNETRWIPVMRMRDNHPVKFFYYARGCSDTYIRANASTARLAHDRIHALRLLTGSDALFYRSLGEWCKHWLEKGGVDLLLKPLLHNAAHASVGATRAMISGSGCLNTRIFMLMREQQVETLILNYEVPGDYFDASTARRKIEIIHTGALYGADGNACAVRWHRNCMFCNNSTVSRRMCINGNKSLTAT